MKMKENQRLSQEGDIVISEQSLVQKKEGKAFPGYLSKGGGKESLFII